MKRILMFVVILMLVIGCSSGGSNNPVVPPPVPVPDPVPTVTSITLAWDANPVDEGVEGYEVFVGTESGVYTQVIKVSDTSLKIDGLTVGTRYYFAAKAYRGTEESDYCSEIYADL